MLIGQKRKYLLAALEPLKVGLDVEKCAAWLRAEFHQDRPPACPECGQVPTGKPARTLQEGNRIKCPACGKGFTHWSGTVFEGAKITPAEFVLFRVALAAGLDHAGIMQLTSRGPQAVTHWTRKIQEFEQRQERSA